MPYKYFLCLSFLFVVFLLALPMPATQAQDQALSTMLKEYQNTPASSPGLQASKALAIARIYFRSGSDSNTKEALRFAEIAVKKGEEAGDINTIAEAYQAMGFHFSQFSETFTQSTDNLNKAYRLFYQEKNWSMALGTLFVLGSVFDKQEEYAKAADVFSRYLKIVETNQISDDRINTVKFRLVEAREKMGDGKIASGNDVYGQNFDYSDEKLQKIRQELESEYEETIANIAYLRNKDSITYAAQKRKIDRQYQQRIKEYDTKFQIEEERAKRLEERNKLQEETITQYYLIGLLGAALLLLIAFFWVMTMRNKRRISQANNELLERNNKIIQQKEEIEAQNNKLEKKKSDLEEQTKKADDLLNNILPATIAIELKKYGSAEPRSYSSVSILFTDFIDFTTVAAGVDPRNLVEELNFCFSAFDEIVSKHRLEKIKTIGDAYMCVGGLPIPNKTHAADAINAAMEMHSFLKERQIDREAEDKFYFKMRAGIHTGSVVAGVVGNKKFAYDIWGDAVNIASRMESSSEEGRVNISEQTYKMVKEQFICTERGKVPVKHRGEIKMYFAEVAR